ncbi:MAG: hypothetical protein ACYDBB_02680 [Armatimonadota bacterium]
MTTGCLFEEYHPIPTVLDTLAPSGPVAPVMPAPFYATDLRRLDFPASPEDDDVTQDGKCYRRLSPEYYAWLRAQMLVARERHARGLLPDVHYQALRDRFNALHDVAMACFGEAALLQTIEHGNVTAYTPPSVRISRAASVLFSDVAGCESWKPVETAPAQDWLTEPVSQDDTATIAPAPQTRRFVQSRAGDWSGWIITEHPADEWFPNGWADIVTSDGQPGQADLRYLHDANGRPLIVSPQFTPYELRAMELARNECPEDFDDLEASLPILSYPIPGDWRFEASPSFEDYLKINDIRERAHTLGWSDAELFQTCSNLAFPYGQDYGLVSFLHGRAIGDITADGVALLPEKPGGAVLTFHRPHRKAQEA